jgi:hypothetical protein
MMDLSQDSQNHKFKVDSTLLKFFFKTVKEGDFEEIVSTAERLKFDLKMAEDENEQNVCFWVALIKNDDM